MMFDEAIIIHDLKDEQKTQEEELALNDITWKSDHLLRHR